MEQNKRGFGKGVALGVGISAVVVAAVVWLFLIVMEVTGAQLVLGGSSIGRGSSSEVLSSEALAKLDRIKTIIDQYYLYDVDEEALVDGIYKGMVSALGDPYSAYYTEEEFASQMEDNEGVYVGIGVKVQQDVNTGYIKVVQVFRNGPAEEAGIQVYDYLVEADGTDFYNMDINTAVTYIRGEENTTVHLKWYRGGEYLEGDVERRQVESETVVYEMLEDGIGYLQLTEFSDITVEQTKNALEDLKSQGMEGLILDLRDNPGGLLTSVVSIADEFAPQGVVTTIKEKDGTEEVYETEDDEYLNLPLVVLVNGNSASASEILTGVIRDYQVGTIVGTKTFGKGIVQQTFSLGDDTALKVTMADYYTPNGESIHQVGITPDVVVEKDDNTETDNQLEKALEVLKEKMQ